mgnify:CR=1 FL=1
MRAPRQDAIARGLFHDSALVCADRRINWTLVSESRDAAVLLAGRYHLVQRIGEGGTGVVYRSFDRELEDWVAVKLLRGERLARESSRTSLRRVVKLARRVAHRNVARVFEFGRLGELQFLTMEYIAGESLQTRLDRAPRLSPGQALDLAIDLCRGLAAAHAVGAVHGDLKPSNILFAPGRGVVLTDFGLSRSLDDPAAQLAVFARDAFCHAAPELRSGAAPSPRADLYSFACVLFEALTGMPARVWRILADEADEAEELDPLDEVGARLRKLAPTLPDDWHALLAACLQPRPESRPADAQTVLARLVAQHRGAGSLALSLADDGDEPAAPLGVGAGVRWIAVSPFTATDGGPGDCAWIAADVIQALRHVRSLRVVSDGRGPDVGPLVQVHGELQRLADGLRVTVRIATEAGVAASVGFVLEQPRELLPSLGVELAARILGAVDLAPQASRTDPEPCPADAVDRYIEGRAAMLQMRTADALQHFEAGLALAPRHSALRLAYTVVRVRHTILYRSPSVDELVELRALVEATIAGHSESGEAYLAMAVLLFTLDEPIEAMRWACSATARAPCFGALALIGSMLTDIGRLPDAARRFDIAAALEQGGPQLWLCRAKLAAYQGRWSDFYAIFDGPLTRLRVRSVYLAHFMMWQPDRGSIDRLAAAVADNQDELRPDALRDLRAVVDFIREHGDRRRILDELAAAYARGPRSFHGRRMHMILCEMACVLGDLSRAHELLARADQHTLIEWHWLIHSPNLAVLRGDPRYLAVYARVRERADAVAEVVWG